MKKLIGLISSVFAALLVLSLNVFAASEVENNDDMDKATKINVNTEVSGKTGTSGDKDWYKFELSNICRF